MQLQVCLLLLILLRVPALPTSGWKSEEDGSHSPLRSQGQVLLSEAIGSPSLFFGVSDEEAIATENMRANHLTTSGIQKKDLSITLNKELQYVKKNEQGHGQFLKKIMTKFGINTKEQVTNEGSVLKKYENINNRKVFSRKSEETNRIKRGFNNNSKLKNTKPLSILSMLVEEEEESKREDDEYYNDTPELLQMVPLLQLKSSIKKEDPDDYYQE